MLLTHSGTTPVGSQNVKEKAMSKKYDVTVTEKAGCGTAIAAILLLLFVIGLCGSLGHH
jgi:hypothetical protein